MAKSKQPSEECQHDWRTEKTYFDDKSRVTVLLCLKCELRGEFTEAK